jgi:glycosyltransferase involved in cell wall biosynthesis
MKVAILWTKPSSYLNAALRALAAYGCEILIFNEAADGDAPFEQGELRWISRRHEFHGAPEFRILRQTIESFLPDVILCSWHVPAYQKVCSRLRGQSVRVGCGDNQWRGTLRQQLGRIAAPFHLHRFYDVLFVPGERQSMWARRMGFPEERIWKGLLTCDVAAFQGCRTRRSAETRTFLYAGRLSPEKGIQTLVRAYSAYRRGCREPPWTLIVAGDGPLQDSVSHEPGVDWRGFVPPSQLPAVFARAACFVMPSARDAWCVALHEAACAGLPLIATSACGAAVHLLQDGYNGCLVGPGQADALAQAMARMSDTRASERAEMGNRSSELSRQFSPRRWAATVIKRSEGLIGISRHATSPAVRFET